MGYRSDVVIAFAFKTKEQIDEVMAVYKMRPFVSEHALVDDWTVREWGDVWGLTFSCESYKWYDTYEDIQGLEDMARVVQMFAEERKDAFPFAYRKIRIGEDYNDIEHDTDANDVGDDLIDILHDRVNIHREIQINF